MKRSISWLRSLSRTKKVLLGMATLFVITGVATSGQQPNNLSNSSAADETQIQQSQAQTKQPKAAKASTVTTKTTTEIQSVPFPSTTVNTISLAKGTTKVTTVGVNGSQTLTYQVTYTSGKQTAKKLVSTTVTVQPITQVTSIGTYVAPPPPPPTPAANTYTNVDGNQIESPDSNSAGATGVCNDGTYTHAVHHQGACSSHGGVNYWL